MFSWVANLAPMTPTLLWSKRSLFPSPSLSLSVSAPQCTHIIYLPNAATAAAEILITAARRERGPR